MLSGKSPVDWMELSIMTCNHEIMTTAFAYGENRPLHLSEGSSYRHCFRTFLNHIVNWGFTVRVSTSNYIFPSKVKKKKREEIKKKTNIEYGSLNPEWITSMSKLTLLTSWRSQRRLNASSLQRHLAEFSRIYSLLKGLPFCPVAVGHSLHGPPLKRYAAGYSVENTTIITAGMLKLCMHLIWTSIDMNG